MIDLDVHIRVHAGSPGVLDEARKRLEIERRCSRSNFAPVTQQAERQRQARERIDAFERAARLAEVRLVETPEKSTMTIITRFASIADMEQLLGIGKGEGTRLAVEQIDAILAITTAS